VIRASPGWPRVRAWPGFPGQPGQRQPRSESRATGDHGPKPGHQQPGQGTTLPGKDDDGAPNQPVKAANRDRQRPVPPGAGAAGLSPLRRRKLRLSPLRRSKLRRSQRRREANAGQGRPSRRSRRAPKAVAPVSSAGGFRFPAAVCGRTEGSRGGSGGGHRQRVAAAVRTSHRGGGGGGSEGSGDSTPKQSGGESKSSAHGAAAQPGPDPRFQPAVNAKARRAGNRRPRWPTTTTEREQLEHAGWGR